MRHHGFTLLAVLLLAGPGCNGDDGDDDSGTEEPTEEPEVITGIQNLPGGNPLVPDMAAYPFPSDFYLVEDGTTVTGRRLQIADEAMPEDMAAATFGEADGFSRVPPILTYVPGGVDPASLPDPTDPTAAQADDSSVWLMHEQTLERVPLLVELDLNAAGPHEQALIIRPQVTLEPNTGYVVVIRDGVRLLDGTTPPITEAFRALRDGIDTDCAEVEAQRADFEAVAATVDAADIDPAEVVQAWIFHTRSEEQNTSALVSMQATAGAWPLDGWSIDSDAWDGEDRIIYGTFTAPDFLGEDDWIAVDDQGEAIQHGTREVPFMLTIPITASDRTRPVIVFGHGFFSAMEEPTWSSLNRGIHAWEMMAATTSFIGFCEDDLVASMAIVAGDLNQLWKVISQQMQSHVHFTLLARLLSEELPAEVTAEDGTPLIDPDAIHYMGISNGGTQGLVIMAASPAFERGVLVVPGGGWSHMIQRAVQWNTMGVILAEKYDDPRDLQLGFSLMQLLFDPIDALNWAGRLTEDRYDGRTDVKVTLHEAVGDCQVANMVTEWVARSGDIPLITPSPRDIVGVPTVSAEPPDGTDSPSALLIYDENYPPLPEGNVAPLEDNEAHGTIRDLEAYTEQVGTFLETGAIVQVCDGACDPD